MTNATITLREGWLVLDAISPHGEDWNFKEHEPDYVEEAYDHKLQQFVPGRSKRIFYCEADAATLTTTTEDDNG